MSAIGSNLFGLLKSWLGCATQSCLSYYLKTSMLKTVESLALLHHGSLRLHSKITKSHVTNLQKNLKTVVFLDESALFVCLFFPNAESSIEKTCFCSLSELTL